MDGRLHIGVSSLAEHSTTVTTDRENTFNNRPAQPAAESPLHPSRHDSGCLRDRDALYAEFAPLVRRLIGRYGNTAELRRDLPGEIYFRFCGLLNAFDPSRGIPLRPYLVRQLTAATYVFARQNWRIASREFNLDEADTGFSSAEDPTGTWLQAISQQQVAARLPDAMERLPRRQRQVVIWRYYEERSFDEIAEILGVKNATVRSLLRHGLANLRQQIVVPDSHPSES